MRVDLITREYPPHIYGGAGVHVTELAAVLRSLLEVKVHCFDGPRNEKAVKEYEGVFGYDDIAELADSNAAIRTLGVDLSMVKNIEGADLVHSHTWYANMAGHWASLLYDIPHVISAHSLEPLRPWKAEQLGGGYRVSSWAERTAYEGAAGIVAVSHAMRADILRSYPKVDPNKVHVIHNGIDLSSWKAPKTEEEKAKQAELLKKYGLDTERPIVAFVGRITRQKGMPYMLRALNKLPDGVQAMLCAGAPDTPEIAREVEGLVNQLQEKRQGIVWITDMLPRNELTALLDACTLFITPSIYEPLGIVNLEAMAMSLPVVATATGGIPDVVVDGETGYLVPIEQVKDGTGTPVNPEKFENDLIERVNKVLSEPQKAKEMGIAGRKRAGEHFTWEAIGQKTAQLYKDILKEGK